MPRENSKPALSLQGALQPQNIEAEKAVLGALLMDEDARDDLIQALQDKDFFAPAHRLIFATAKDLLVRGIQVDLVTVSDELGKQGGADRPGLPDYLKIAWPAYQKAGGSAYLAELTANLPGISVALHYASIVREKSELRHLLHITLKTQESVLQEGEVDKALDLAESELSKLRDRRLRGNRHKISDIIESVVGEYDKRMLGTSESAGLHVHYSDLMNFLGGFRSGEMIIIAARPSVGKTTFALNLLYDFSLMQNLPAILFSLEMGREQIGNNLVCRDADLDSHVWMNKTRSLDAAQKTRLTQAFDRLSKTPLWIDDDSGLTPSMMHAKLRRYQRENGLRIAFIDYLQLMYPDVRRQNREEEMREISRSIKGVARDLKIPVVALAQLNRQVEARGGKKPAMSDLRESGSLEQDADLILLLHRPDSYETTDRPGEVDVIVAKNRNGPTGTATLFYTREKCRFENFSRG